MKSLRRITIFFIPLFIIGLIVSLLYKWNYIQHAQHIPSEFDIPERTTSLDTNNNKIDDSVDILTGALDYTSRNPQYEDLKEYSGGWPKNNKGQNGDVIANALLNAGYDLRVLINQDIEKNPEVYGNNPKGEDVAFRVVDNQRIFFSRYANSKDLDYTNIREWQTGDIVFFEKNHAAIVGDKVNDKGIRFIVHHFWGSQAGYFQDVLETDAWGKVVGHYSVSLRMLSPKTDYK